MKEWGSKPVITDPSFEHDVYTNSRMFWAQIQCAWLGDKVDSGIGLGSTLAEGLPFVKVLKSTRELTEGEIIVNSGI